MACLFQQKRLLLLFCLILPLIGFIAAPLEARLFYNPHLTYSCYRLIDLGPTDLPQCCLARDSFPVSLGPRINQKGHVIGNTSYGGFVTDLCNPKSCFQRNGTYAFFHGINNNGLVLASVNQADGSGEWYLWSYVYCRHQETPLPLNLKCLNGGDVHFRSINDNGLLTGARKVKDKEEYMAVFYSPEKGIQDLSCAYLLGANNSGNMVGFESPSDENTPLLYHYRGGWNGFSDEACLKKPKGKIQFQMDMTIAHDSAVFGSFRSTKNGRPYMWAYEWTPIERYFRVRDLSGMKISAVNSCHTIVGSLCGEAAISINMEPPVVLSSLVHGGCKEMTLIEATDINDVGQIVGYGRSCGSLHLFLLDPIR
ncbi:hypothetical protein [Estrella lausannensis]|uniref:Conserved putative secreted protein n=1 Tax=Estrella lausannensis TaxID=483423 RepID=A0A0H5DQD8_9BACT|nr:hypothetical protein [Estrella lausannensis]CRX38861.1 Conserved putative secreted protein [Estrella lausannensis]